MMTKPTSTTLSSALCRANSVATDRIAPKSMPVLPPSATGLPTLLAFTIWKQMNILCTVLLVWVLCGKRDTTRLNRKKKWYLHLHIH